MEDEFRVSDYLIPLCWMEDIVKDLNTPIPRWVAESKPVKYTRRQRWGFWKHAIRETVALRIAPWLAPDDW